MTDKKHAMLEKIDPARRRFLGRLLAGTGALALMGPVSTLLAQEKKGDGKGKGDTPPAKGDGKGKGDTPPAKGKGKGKGKGDSTTTPPADKGKGKGGL